jgi:hypothetical protein
MSKIRVVILQSNRKALIKETDPKRPYTRHQEGHYILASESVANYEVDGVVEGSEIIFFQGNPNPVSYSSIQVTEKDGETLVGVEDKSGTYMDNVVMENALRQTSLGPKVNLGALMGYLEWFKKPMNWVYGLMALSILWGLIEQFLGGSV